jgi:serine/threonine protein kinase
METVLNYGTHNCAILQRGGRVFRIAAVRRNSQKIKMMERAGQILASFRKMEHALGPSVLFELEAGAWLDPNTSPETRAWLEGIKCEPIERARPLERYMFYTQTIEYADGGDLGQFYQGAHDEDNGEFALMLIWFFYVAQAHFGFRHRDMKPSNVVVRRYVGPRTFRFYLDARDQFEVTTTNVPVVIDLDFGSFYTSAHHVTQYQGTEFYMPMEVSLDVIRNEARDHGDAVDWYSIGLTMFVFWCKLDPVRLYGGFGMAEERLAHALGARTPSPAQLRASEALCVHITLARALEPTTVLPKDVAAAARRAGLLKSALSIYLMKQVRALVNEQPDKAELLRTLLSTDPERRYMNGEPWKLLTAHALFDKFTSAWSPLAPLADWAGLRKTYSYPKEPVLRALDPNNERFRSLVRMLERTPNLEEALCVGCAAQTEQMCQCCRKPFCGVGCQARFH